MDVDLSTSGTNGLILIKCICIGVLSVHCTVYAISTVKKKLKNIFFSSRYFELNTIVSGAESVAEFLNNKPGTEHKQK